MKLLYTIVLIYAAYKDIKTLHVRKVVNITIFLMALVEGCCFVEAILITLPFLIIAVRTDTMGGGDVKFIFTNACLLGIEKIYTALLIGFGILAFQYLVMKLGKRKMNKKVPLLPYLVTGLLYAIY